MSIRSVPREVINQQSSYVYETTVICDCCGKKSHDDGEPKFGGCVHAGYLNVHKNVGLAHTCAGIQNSWDFCSEECTIKYFDMKGYR